MSRQSAPTGAEARFPVPRVEPVFTLFVDVEPPIATETTPAGIALLIPIVGGRVAGPRLSGELLRGGEDSARDRPSGIFQVHARYHLRTDDGVTIAVENLGVWRERPGESPYFVTAPTFTAPDGQHSWLNRGVFIGMAVERSIERIEIDVSALTAGSVDLG